MIRIDPAQTVERETNRHVENDASTLIETDASDRLSLMDRFQSVQAQLTGSNRSSSGSGSCSGGDCGCHDCGTKGSSSASKFRNQSKEGANSLWSELLCANAMAEGHGRRRRSPLQMLFDALFMRLTNCGTQVLTDSLQIHGNNVQYNERAVNNRLRNALGRSQDMLSERSQMQASQKMGVSTKFFERSIRVGDQIKKLDRDDTTDPQETVDLINALSEDGEIAEYLDMQAEYALLDTLIDQAIVGGTPEAIEEVLSRLQTDDQRKELLLGRVRDAAFNSDFYTIDLTLEYASSQAILARVPTIIHDILQYYVQPESDAEDKNQVALDDLIDLLERLNPKWDVKVRNGTEYKNLYVFSMASHDARRLFKFSNTYRPMILLSPKFPKENYQSIMRQYYPRMRFSEPTY